MAQQESYPIEIREKFENKFWRLNNLYWIIDKRGKRVKFHPNEVQEQLFDDLWYLNVVLKARQFGITTFVDLYFLDECIFNNDVEAGIIAHNITDAQKIFRRKVKYPYDNLPEQIRDQCVLTTDSKTELVFNNNSAIYVGTSMRSGTVQYLHVSEHAKICRKYPEKAEEIKTGSFNAVETGQMIVVESTAEGAYGDFYDICQRARSQKDDDLTEMDFKFHFYPWFLTGEYTLPAKNVTITEEETKYFNGLESSLKIKISPEQRAWYVKKQDLLGEKMKQEFPSTPDEAFESGGEGLFFDRAYHVTDCREVPEGAKLYMSFDWGYAKPYSVGYWWIDADGRMMRFSELYGKNRQPDARPDTGLRQSDPEIAEAIMHQNQIIKVAVKGRLPPKFLLNMVFILFLVIRAGI